MHDPLSRKWKIGIRGEISMQASVSLGAPSPFLPKIILKRLEKLTSPDMTLYKEVGKGNAEDDEV